MTKHLHTIFLVLGMGLSWNIATPQDYNPSVTIQGGGQVWNFENAGESFRQNVFPVRAVIPVGQRVTLEIAGTPASTVFDTLGLSSAGDTRLRGSFHLVPNSVVLNIGASIPTGRSSLSVEEFLLSSVLANNALHMKAPSSGGGQDINAGIALARELGGFTLGGGVGYLHKGELAPFDGMDDLKYQPGHEVNITAGIDVAGDIGYSIDLTYTMQQSDKYNGVEAFKSGNRLYVDAQLTKDFDSARLIAFARNRTRGKNSLATAAGLQTEAVNSNGNQAEIGVLAYIPASQMVLLKVLANGWLYSENGMGLGSAALGEFGGGFRLELTPALALDMTAKYAQGALDLGTEKDVSVTGYSVFGGIQYQFNVWE